MTSAIPVPRAPGREIIGTRLILAHAHFHVDQDVIGGVVDRDIPAIHSKLQVILAHAYFHVDQDVIGGVVD